MHTRFLSTYFLDYYPIGFMNPNMISRLFRIFLVLLFLHGGCLYSQGLSLKDADAISLNLDWYLDLSDLEYDDSPYPGRTNIGHVIIPYFAMCIGPFELNAGAWYRQKYIYFDETHQPERVYPFMNAVFHPGPDSGFLIGNYPNLNPLPSTIYNEFLFFEERPVSSGMKFSIDKTTLDFTSYLDWIKPDTEEHPEEFIAGAAYSHELFDWFYYKFFAHLHHKGGQLNKDTHPVRIQQDLAFSPLLGFAFKGIYAEFEYYLSAFSQNFETSVYGHAGSGTLGFERGDFDVSYQCFYNRDYYHGDAHIFYNKRRNLLHRIRLDYDIFKYREILDLVFTMNIYGMDPPGIDFRLFARINLNLIEYRPKKNDQTGSTGSLE